MSTLRNVSSLRSLPSCGKNRTLAVALPVGGKKTPVRGLIKGNNRLLLVNSRRCAFPTAQLRRGFMCSARPLAHISQGYHEVVGATPSATAAPAAQGFKWLDDLARRREEQAGFTFKEKDSKPFALGVVKIVAGPPVGREQTVQDCFKSWSRRLQQRRPSTNPTDRIANHMTATHSSPGGGKTTLLDYLALYLQDLLHLCEDEELKQILQRAVPISMTFNGGTNLRTWELDDTPQFNLLLRVLFSYYCDPAKSSYEAFYWFVAPMLRGLPGLSLRSFLSIVEAPVILLLDELMKAGSDERCGAILSEIGNALNEVEDFNVLVTTLDTNPLSSLKDSLTLIAACRSAVPQAGSKEGIQVAKLRCVRQATSDCVGHPRSLQYLADVLKAMTDEEIHAMHQNHTSSETYVALMKKVVEQAMF
ncbi:hypothetical protein QOT17_008198 [Balamuthia mandrillaris]